MLSKEMESVILYREEELVRIAKRENNKKRSYLVVNPLQGKHIPVSPKRVFSMFRALAETLREEYIEEKLLLIGFAETATAVGAALAVEVGSRYIHTTRETVEGADYLFFSETHSHATEQKLVKQDIDGVIADIDRIIFVEDEVTTGNTILNIIDILEERYEKKPSFSVASLLNGMEKASLTEYRRRGIDMHYLVKTDHRPYSQIAEAYRDSGEYKVAGAYRSSEITRVDISVCLNARRLVDAKTYEEACHLFWEKLESEVELDSFERILVLGTEEFMYPALYVAHEIEKKGKKVNFHATTRSPITVSEDEGYPLYRRWELKSLYDKERITYLYNLETYDCVLIVTDSAKEEGEESLFSALFEQGNERIIKVRWS